jgi:hypothetical protein
MLEAVDQWVELGERVRQVVDRIELIPPAGVGPLDRAVELGRLGGADPAGRFIWAYAVATASRVASHRRAGSAIALSALLVALPALAADTLVGPVTLVRDGDTIEVGGMSIRL